MTGIWNDEMIGIDRCSWNDEMVGTWNICIYIYIHCYIYIATYTLLHIHLCTEIPIDIDEIWWNLCDMSII